MAEIREEKANDAIYEIGKAFKGTYTLNLVIGSGSDEAEEGKWVWASDGQLFIEIWTNGTATKIAEQYSYLTNRTEISEGYNSRKIRNCMSMNYQPGFEGMWNSVVCKRGRRVVCEAKPVSGKALELRDVPKDF